MLNTKRRGIDMAIDLKELQKDNEARRNAALAAAEKGSLKDVLPAKMVDTNHAERLSKEDLKKETEEFEEFVANSPFSKALKSALTR
jgi:hypothetical protein